jgi:hypothetical protein
MLLCCYNMHPETPEEFLDARLTAQIHRLLSAGCVPENSP